MLNNVALIEELALKAATDYINSNRELNNSIASMAVSYQLNPNQIQRVVERANRIVFLKMYKSNEDKTFSFPLADTASILGIVNGSPANINSDAYNLKGVALEDLPTDAVPNADRFYNAEGLTDPDVEPAETETPVVRQPLDLPEGAIREVYVIVDGNTIRPNSRNIEKLIHSIKMVQAQEKTAAMMAGSKLGSIKGLFEQLLRSGMSAENIIGGIFAKLPAFLKNKAVPVVQKIVDSLFREGKIKQQVDVNQSMLKFGEYDPYYVMAERPIEEIVEGVVELEKYASEYREALAKKAEMLVELGQVRELFPDYYINLPIAQEDEADV